jgi:beta-lactamase class A
MIVILRRLLVLAALPLAAAACRAVPASSVRIERVAPATEWASADSPVSRIVAPAARTAAARAPTTATPPLAQPSSPATATATAQPPTSARPAPAPTEAPRLTPAAPVAAAVPARPPGTVDDPALLSAIRDALGPDADRASVVARRLSDGAGAAWDGDRVFYAASLYKLEVLYEAYRQRQLGVLDFGRRVPVGERYTAQDLGTLERLPLGPDGDIEVGEAVHAMVTYSDNTSAALLLDLLGHRNIDATMAALGLQSSSVNTPDLPTTAADMARLMAAIVRGEGLDAASAQEMTALLLGQENRSGIPRGVPAGIPVGNKWGGWEGDLHDVAVVLAPRGAYVLAILTDGAGGWDLITRVSRAVFDYWNTNGGAVTHP